MFCPNCGKEIKDGVTFCPFCGSRVDSGESDSGSAAPAASENDTDKSRYIIIGIIAAVVVILVIVLAVLLMGGRDDADNIQTGEAETQEELNTEAVDNEAFSTADEAANVAAPDEAIEEAEDSAAEPVDHSAEIEAAISKYREAAEIMMHTTSNIEFAVLLLDDDDIPETVFVYPGEYFAYLYIDSSGNVAEYDYEYIARSGEIYGYKEKGGIIAFSQHHHITDYDEDGDGEYNEKNYYFLLSNDFYKVENGIFNKIGFSQIIDYDKGNYQNEYFITDDRVQVSEDEFNAYEDSLGPLSAVTTYPTFDEAYQAFMSGQ